MSGEQSKTQAELYQRRLELVQSHIAAENCHDIEQILASFVRPRYELVALNECSEGEDAVRLLIARLFQGFPNLYVEVFTLRHADDAIIVEGRIVGTQLGDCAGISASGRVINCPYVGIFEFDEDRLQNEKLYFDMHTILRQLR